MLGLKISYFPLIYLDSLLFGSLLQDSLLLDSLLSDRSLLDSSIGQSHSKLQFKSTNLNLRVTLNNLRPPLSVF